MNRRLLLLGIAATPIAILAAPFLPKSATGGLITEPLGFDDRYVCFDNLGIRFVSVAEDDPYRVVFVYPAEDAQA